MSVKALWVRGVEICLIFSLVWLAGCGDGSSSPSPGTTGSGSQTTVVVAPAETTADQGTTVQFEASVSGRSNQAVTRSMGAAGLGTIDSAGLSPTFIYGCDPL